MKIKSSKILVIGDVMIDRYIIGDHNRDSPEADCAILNYSRTEDRLGGAANVAYNLSQLNQEVTLLSVTGDDEGAAILKNLCSTNRINCHALIDPERPTTIKTRYVNDAYKQYLRLDHETTQSISTEIENNLINRITEISKSGIELIIIQDYNKGLLTNRIIDFLQSVCKENNIRLSVDPKHKNFRALSDCDLFKPNLKELEHQYGRKINVNKDEIKNVLKKLDMDKANAVYVTLADKGIYFQQGDDYGIINGLTVTDPDVSGAGDTVISVLSILLLHGLSCNDMAAISNKCGAYVCKEQGVYFVKNTDFQELIHQTIVH